MEFLWPGFLFLLLLIPLLVGLYIWMLRRRRFAVRYSSLELVRAALPKKSNWRRHLPIVLFLLGFASLIFALGRPVAILNVPTYQTTIILTMDVSGSMRSRDIPPRHIRRHARAQSTPPIRNPNSLSFFSLDSIFFISAMTMFFPF